MNKLYPKTNKKFTIHKGSPYPMGATLSDEGVNFAFFLPAPKKSSFACLMKTARKPV